jgi:anti-repressor protein
MGMNDLILNGELTMSSREIAELTGKRHDHVLEDVRKMLSELELSSPEFSGVYKDQQLIDRPCFNLPKDLTLTLVSGYSIKLRKKIIDRWMELESKSVISLPNFNDPVAAARAWADEREQKLLEKIGREQAEAQIEQDRPKVEFAMAVRNMQGACKLGDFAKALGTGRNRLFKWLREAGILMANRMPYQQFIDRGLFVVVEQIPYTDSKGKTHPAFTTMVTGVGQVWLEEKYRGAMG